MKKKSLLKVIKKAEALSFRDAASGRFKDADICNSMFRYLRKAMEEYIMTDKEKAKAYDKALERARNYHSKGFEYVSYIFPELKESGDERIESEDEKIRHYLMNFVKINDGVNLPPDYAKKALAWLEKQGEQKPEENKGNVGEISPNSECGEEDKGIIEEVVSYLINYSNIVESKEDADRIEYLIDKIQDICPHQKQEWSEEDEPQKELAESYLAVFDKKFPILPTLKGKQLADYKNFLNRCQQIFGLKYWGIRPIQAKLFEKLSLLWAAWGAEHLQGLGQTDGDMDDEILWSEEDEKIINGLIDSLTRISLNTRTDSTSPNYTFYKEIDWLKSIRPQPKQSLDEDTQQWIDTIIKDYEDLYNTDKDHRATIQAKISILKSLRPQNKWKPSDEQIRALKHAFNDGSITFAEMEILATLYEGLKSFI